MRKRQAAGSARTIFLTGRRDGAARSPIGGRSRFGDVCVLRLFTGRLGVLDSGAFAEIIIIGVGSGGYIIIIIVRWRSEARTYNNGAAVRV